MKKVKIDIDTKYIKIWLECINIELKACNGKLEFNDLVDVVKVKRKGKTILKIEPSMAAKYLLLGILNANSERVKRKSAKS